MRTHPTIQKILNNEAIMKKLLSGFISLFILVSVSLINQHTNAAANEKLQLSAESNLTLINRNTYMTGICGTITADSLMGEFAHTVTLTSPEGVVLSGDALVPSDTVVSKGTASIRVLIYGDVNRSGHLNLSDVSSMLKFIAKWDIDVCDAAIDLNWDSKNTLADVSLLLKKISGWNVCIGVDIVPEQITLSYYDKDCTAIGVIWHSAKKTHHPAVQVAEGITDDFRDAKTYLGDTNTGSGDANSRAILTDLEPGKTYSYRVGDTSGFWGDPAYFTMGEEDPSEFTFVCFTDTQSRDSRDTGICFKTAWRTASPAYDIDFAVHCGDVVESVDPYSWREMLETSSDYLRSIPIMAVSGNHETSYAGNDGFKMQYNHFNTHVPDQTSVEKGYFYSFTYGNVHFVMLNTNNQGTVDDSLSDEQITWLRSDLEENDAKWTIAVMHHPIYSTGSGSSDRWEDPMVIAMRAQLAPIFAEYGVDIVLAGHDHIYYCTHPIDGSENIVSATTEIIDGTVYYNDPEGVIYTTPGCTGSSARSLCDTHPEYYRHLKDGMTRSFLAVTVEENKLTVDFCIPVLGTECEVYDSWGIIK